MKGSCSFRIDECLKDEFISESGFKLGTQKSPNDVYFDGDATNRHL